MSDQWPDMVDADDVVWERAMFRLFVENKDFFDEYVVEELGRRGALDHAASQRLARFSSDGRRP